jgi:hypothetical protein
MKRTMFVGNEKKVALALTAVLALMTLQPAHAQAIGPAIDGAASSIKNIFGNVSNLILMIGAVTGLAGAIRVYIKWQNGDQDLNKHLIGWTGSCIFLLLSGTILKLFYGL